MLLFKVSKILHEPSSIGSSISKTLQHVLILFYVPELAFGELAVFIRNFGGKYMSEYVIWWWWVVIIKEFIFIKWI